MSNEMKPPKRRFAITMSVSGDTLADALALARHFIEAAEEGSRNVTSGGYSNGGYFEITEDPEQTHERFIEQLNQWIRHRDGDVPDGGFPEVAAEAKGGAR